jgi:twinkle protein
MNNLILNDSIDLSSYLDDSKIAMLVKPAKNWADDLYDALLNIEETVGAYLPWLKAHNKFRLRLGEVTIWAGDSGAGKSYLLNQIAMSLAGQSIKSVIASFEMPPLKTLERMCTQHSLQNDFMTLNKVQIQSLIESIENRVWLYTQTGNVDFKRLIAVIKYCSEQLGTQHFFIDSLMMITASDDERQLFNLQRNVVQQFVKLANDLNIHIHLVAHFRKPAHGEKVSKNDISGHKDVTNLAHNVVLLQNNILPDGSRVSGDADLWITVDKQRFGAFKGSIPLYRTNDVLMFKDTSPNYREAY